MRTKQVVRHARDWVPYSFYRRSKLPGDEDEDDKEKKKNKKKATATTRTSPIRTRGFEKKEEMQKRLEKMNVATSTSSSPVLSPRREKKETLKRLAERASVVLIREPDDWTALASSAPLLRDENLPPPPPREEPEPKPEPEPAQRRVTEFSDEMLRDLECGRALFLHHNSVPDTPDWSPKREVVPPKMLERYRRQVEESGGYDVDCFPKLESFLWCITPVVGDGLKHFEHLAHIAIEKANNEKQDGPLLYEKLVKLNLLSGGWFTYFMTLEVIDSADGKKKTCRTKMTKKPGHVAVVLEFKLMPVLIKKK